VPLWSVGGKWDLDKEKFFNIKWLPILKLRLTYGYRGNLDKLVTAYTVARYTTGNLINTPYAQIISAGNPELRWEKIGILNAGIDFGILKNRINGSFEYFFKNGKDIIGDNPVAPSTGFLTVRGNFSDIKVNGFDFVMNTINVDRRIRWSTQFTVSYAKDEIVKYKGSQSLSQFMKLEGKAITGLYSYRWGGLDPATGDPRGYLADTLSKNYTAIVNAIRADLDLLRYHGPSNPMYFATLRNDFEWQDFSISINFTYKGGYYFPSRSISYTDFFNSWRGHIDYLDRWQKPGDEQSTNIPSMVYPANSGRDAFYANSEALVEKGDHIRLKDIRIGYFLTKSKWHKLPMKSIQLFAYMKELGIIWKATKKNIDPDNLDAYPAVFNLSVGFKAQF
jgi:hypothetical protein